MTLYTRPQLVLLLLLVVAAGVGLGVQHWRRLYPHLVERLESLDRAATPPSIPLRAPGAPPATGVRGGPAPTPAESAGPQRTAPPARVTPEDPLDAIDLNHASAAELARLPGIGATLAERIVQARADAPFASVEDLRRVRGVGRATLARVRSRLDVTR